MPNGSESDPESAVGNALQLEKMKLIMLGEAQAAQFANELHEKVLAGQ